MNKSSTILFPLRTNVNFFRSSIEYLDLKSRVKQSLILYDKILFQAGEYHCFVGPGGVIQNYQSQYNKERGKKPVMLEDEGKDSKRFWLQIRPTGAAPSVPSTTLIDSELERSFRSQFHTLVTEIKGSGISEVELRYFEFPDTVKKHIKDVTKKDKKNLQYEQGSKFLKDTIITNLNKDLLLMTILGLPANIDALHGSIIHQKIKQDTSLHKVPGYLSIDTWVPYVGNLNWKEIFDFRSHPSLIELRNKLVEVEERARLMLGEASDEDIRKELSNILTDELLQEIQHIRPSSSEITKDIGKDVSVCLLGTLFPPIGLALDIASIAADIPDFVEVINQKKSWITALMNLRTKSN